MVVTIRRHPIGLLAIYIQTVAGLAALIALPLLMSPDLLAGNSIFDNGLLSIGFLLILSLGLMIIVLGTSVYRQSQLVLTNKSLIQTLQHAIFNRKVSRLALSDIEDVTYEQKGLLQTTLNYGTLHIETAGELKNFAFRYCPDPDKYSDRIIKSRKQFSKGLED